MILAEPLCSPRMDTNLFHCQTENSYLVGYFKNQVRCLMKYKELLVFKGYPLDNGCAPT